MSKIYVYSTLSNDQQYTHYAAASANNLTPAVEKSILIAGKANITSKHFITPLGMATEVTAEDLALLKQNAMFKIHEANGFITYSEVKEDADKMASVMTGRDQSAPLVEEDFKESEPKLATRRGRPKKED